MLILTGSASRSVTKRGIVNDGTRAQMERAAASRVARLLRSIGSARMVDAQVESDLEQVDRHDVFDGDSGYGVKDLCCTEEQLRAAVMAAEASSEAAKQYCK